MPRFLPSLRRRGPVASKDLQVRNEVKAVLADYYSSLWQYEAHRRARYWPVERAVVEGYERVIWCFKPVNQIGGDHSKLPFKLTEGNKPACDDNDHPLLHVLNVQANPLETGKVFRKRLSAQVLLSKAGAFVEMTKSNGGTIKRLDLLPPDRTELIPGTGQDLVDHVKLTRRDGSTRPIDWDKVLWFRDPHPLDPYSGVTPLEAAGMSVELDYFARLYNVSFMQNDGRPGGVLGVRNPDGSTTDMDERLMDRVESRFGKGPVEAGKLSVLAGELSYIDLAAKPRDMQYGATSKNAKIEMLAAFGTPESVLGYSADRTFANAEQEHYNYWTVTMPAHNTIIVDGFGELTEPGLKLELDTSEIEVLQRAEIARREEARNEFTAGLRSIKSYADLAGYGDEIEDTVHTRSLYIPQGKTPLPSRAEDIEALGLGAPAPAAAVPGAAPPAQLEGAPGGDTGAPTGPDVVGPAAAAVEAAGSGAPNGVPPQGAAPDTGTAGTAAAALAAATAGKAARVTPTGRVLLRIDKDHPAPADDVAESDLDESARDRLENVITAALTALSTRWVKRTIARLESPKSRKGTRHWVPDSATDTRGGNKALDSARVVDEQTWADEADEGTRPILAAAAALAAAGLLTDLAADDDHDDESVARIVAPVIAVIIALIRRSTTVKAEQLTALINNADQRGDSIGDIADQIEEAGAKLTTWAEQIAVTVATGTLNGARDAAATEIEAAGYADIERTWLTRRDALVRQSHRATDGQRQPIGSPFVVGNALLRFPCDPLGPIEEIANCRCRLLHRSKRSGRFVAPPVSVAS